MFYEKNIGLSTLPLRPNGIIISISHVCRLQVMFNIIILNVDPKMTQSMPSPIVINAFHSPAAFTFQNKKNRSLWNFKCHKRHKNFVCGSEHFHFSFYTFWDWFSGHRGKKNFAIFLIHTHWGISGFVPETTRWFKYDRDWFVCKQAALRSSCATLREWSHNLHPPSCSG